MSGSKALSVALATALRGVVATVLPGAFAALVLVSFSAFAAGNGTLVVLGIAVVTVVGAATIGYSIVVVGSHEMSVGTRAHVRRSIAAGIPAPQHPATPGRPRTRAPSQSILAA